MSLYSTEVLVTQARRLAADYRRATGNPLGISGEIAEFDASKILNLEVINPKPGGYDAVGRAGRLQGQRVQIKGRAIFEESQSRQRIGQLKTDMDWDSVVLVIMNEDYEPIEVFEAQREVVEEALDEQKGKNKRGSMTLAKFRKIATLMWTKEDGLRVEDEELQAYHATL